MKVANLFEDSNFRMASSGYAYVPASCATGQASNLPVAFHECKQNVATVGIDFYQNAGYNRWSDTNKMIVLYPQATSTAANPNGCWDYHEVNFPAKSVGKMVAHKTMIDRAVRGNAEEPYTCSHWHDSNSWHVYYGRAYLGSDGHAYAVNSNQYLGYYSTAAYTDVRRTSAGPRSAWHGTTLKLSTQPASGHGGPYAGRLDLEGTRSNRCRYEDAALSHHFRQPARCKEFRHCLMVAAHTPP
jgi:hypothetical protein